MKVLIGNGKVSKVLKNNNDVVLSHKEIEIKDITSVNENLKKFPIGTVVVNTAAKINLEWCEENKEESKNVNVVGAINVALACKKFGHKLVHISSGCIFDGNESNKIYTENDNPTPASWYANTKSEADKLITSLGYDNFLIIRPRQLISPKPNETNMLTKFMSIKNGDFIDSPNSITCIEDMKEMIDHLLKNKCVGIYNIANSGVISPFEIAKKISEKFDLQINKISYQNYLKKIKVKRVNTILSIDKILSTGYNPRSASDALEWCLENYGKNI